MALPHAYVEHVHLVANCVSPHYQNGESRNFRLRLLDEALARTSAAEVDDITSDEMDHSRKFPAFSTSKKCKTNEVLGEAMDRLWIFHIHVAGNKCWRDAILSFSIRKLQDYLYQLANYQVVPPVLSRIMFTDLT